MEQRKLESLPGVEMGPIDVHLAALATETRLPILDLGACLSRMEEAGPPLRALLARAAAGEALDEAEETLLFRGVHLLGAARDTSSFQPLMRLLRLPNERLEHLLGDAITEDLAKIVAGTFDGDTGSLFDAIVDAERDEYVRDALMGAAAFLTWAGRIERAEMAAFLNRFFEERLAGEYDFVWDGWAEAIGLLGLNEAAPKVREAFRLEVVCEDYMALSEFETMLSEANARPDDASRFEKANLGYIEDVAEALAWSDYDPKEQRSSRPFDEGLEARDWSTPQQPFINPWKGVGRNDPCPCGSGKKAKKCCLQGK